jgi:hypothetical protein
MSLNLGILSSSQSAAAPSASLLLDTYAGAAVAYSFRKLRTAYTGNCIKVLRASGGSLDIGFVLGVLDTATLLTFAGLSETRISKFYDQSGNGNDANLASFSVSPIIVSSGVLVTDGGKVAANSGYLNLTSGILQNSNFAAYSVMTRIGANTTIGFGTNTANFNYINLIEGTSVISHNVLRRAAYTFTATGRRLFTSLNISNNFTMLNNGVVQTTTPTAQTATGVINQLNGLSGLAYLSVNIFQEHILYNTDQSANNTGIQNNINSFYTIY